MGFCHSQQLKPAKQNKPSPDQHASVIDGYLANEVSQGRVAGPFNSPPLPNLQVSSSGIIPKQGQTGKWHHAAKVVWPGRTFLCRMVDLLCCFCKKDHLIRLNREFHLDLLWWHQFLFQWQGVSFWLFPGLPP